MTVRRAAGILSAILVLLSVHSLRTGAVWAQRTGPVKIGALTASWGPSKPIVGLRDGLQNLSYREDIDFAIGVRSTQATPPSCRQRLASSFVSALRSSSRMEPAMRGGDWSEASRGPEGTLPGSQFSKATWAPSASKSSVS
jgi:hypothetical protein